MKKIIITTIAILCTFQLSLFAQDIETIKSELNKASVNTIFLKDFTLDISPNGFEMFSLVLKKESKYNFYLYNNENIDFSLFVEENEQSVKKTKTNNPKIEKLEFIAPQTGVYSFKIINKLNTNNKTVVLLTTDTNNEVTKALATADVKLNKTKIENEDVYLIVEQLPLFGGVKKPSESGNLFREFIGKNLTYPEEAKKKSLTGTVYVSFIVDKEGYIKDAKVIRGVHPSLDQEALRVVFSSPRWEPGKEKGNPVNVSFTIPIVFNLNK